MIGASTSFIAANDPRATPYFAHVKRALEADGETRVVNAACPCASVLDFAYPDPEAACTDGPGPPLYDQLVTPQLPAATAVVLIGGNDAWSACEPRITTGREYLQALRTVVARLTRDGVQRVVLMTPMPAPAGHEEDPAGRARALVEYRSAVLLVAAMTPGVEVGPDLYHLMSTERHFHDGIHPNAIGMIRIAEALVRHLADRPHEPAGLEGLADLQRLFWESDLPEGLVPPRVP